MKFLPVPVQSISYKLLKKLNYEIRYPNISDHSNIKYSSSHLIITIDTNLQYFDNKYIVKTNITHCINNCYNRYNTKFKTMLINSSTSKFIYEDLEITTDNNNLLEYVFNSLKTYTLNYNLMNDNISQSQYFDKDKSFNYISKESLKDLNQIHF